MKSESLLTACIDANVYISGLAFGGKPFKVIERALNRDFNAVTSQNILQEVRRNLTGKLGLNSKRVDRFIADILEISSVYVPTGKLKVVGYSQDDAVIETAMLGQADVLVTGDKKHLLIWGNIRTSLWNRHLNFWRGSKIFIPSLDLFCRRTHFKNYFSSPITRFLPSFKKTFCDCFENVY